MPPLFKTAAACRAC